MNVSNFVIIVLSISLLSLTSFAMSTSILVTGANTGIGLALCKQLVKDHGAKVFLGSRSPDKGAAAVEAVKKHAGSDSAPVELVVLDVSDDKSVADAASSLKEKGVTLDAIVNNAGRGLQHGAKAQEIINVNLMGVKRVVDNFMPLLPAENGRIVNVGSGSGPMYVSAQTRERQQILCSSDVTWEQIEDIRDNGVATDSQNGYGVSKALVAAYTMYLAKKHPNVLCYSITPGFINTAITAGWGASKEPEEGTVSIKHALFEATKEESGYFFGSDAKRSPLHFLRNPGEPVFDGVYPWDR